MRFLALALLAGGAWLGENGCARAADPVPGEAPPFTASLNDWGEHGLIQDPSARTGTDGDFSFTFSHVHPYDRYNLFATPLPWLEAGFRYTDINNRPYGPASFSGSQTYKDRSFEIKLRLTEESSSFPETAVGVRDLAGTGLFGSEYLVASRRIYDFDVTAGMGWGLMATRAALPNPFGLIDHSFKTRPASNGSGTFSFSAFHGPNVGLFGGVEYHTPIDKLSVKLEFDPDSYQQEPLGNSFTVRSPVNAAIEYHPLSFVDLSAGIERGTTFMLRISLHANLDESGTPQQDTPPPAVEPRKIQPPVGKPLDETRIPQVAQGDAAPLPALSLAETPRQVAARDDVPRAAPAAGEASQGQLPEGKPLDSTTIPQVPGEAATASGVDTLFAGARRLGYRIDDVSLTGLTASLTVSPIRGVKTGSAPALAQLANRSLGVSSTVIAEAKGDDDSAPARPQLLASSSGAVPRATTGRALPQTAAAAPEVAPVDETAIARKVFADLRKIGFTGLSFSLRDDHAYLAFAQKKYRNTVVAIGRAARVVAENAPPEVELITLDVIDGGVTMVSVSLQRSDLERAVAERGSPEEIWANTSIAGADPARPPGVINPNAYPSFNWSLNPRTRQQLGGPNNFLIYEVYAEFAGEAVVAPGLSFNGTLGVNLFNNLNELTLPSTSDLPHVRSDIAKYLKDGQTGVFRLQSDYLFDIAPDLYGRVSGGLLEEMFGGVDGEVLYRPYNQRWAVGLDLSHVYQRDYNDLFSFLPYQVTTGFLSLYYKLPFYNMEAAVHVGRYLAGDKGATIELSRRFDSGVRVGVFATKTNVSAAEFGEGGFDKGFFISIPLDLFFGAPTRDEASFLYRPLTVDAGQMLDISKPLYDATDGDDPDTLSRDWPHLLQ